MKIFIKFDKNFMQHVIIIKKKIYKSVFFLFQNEFNYIENIKYFLLKMGFFSQFFKYKNYVFVLHKNLYFSKLIDKNINKTLLYNSDKIIQILSFKNKNSYKCFIKFILKIIHGLIFG